ncbi:hypothetical protein G6L37_00795 [Agrobacterium rubi]|nr:hypothetical protein [Agrobacterium rubi]NTF23928.1 hypothetical protein [Agrobacterium rubi]
MDTTIRNGAIDAPTAKAAARNLKQRLEALGHVVSLNHAYEGLAATCGYPTWAVMKVRLDALSDAPSVTATGIFPEGRVPWRKFAPGRDNPTTLFFGPRDARHHALQDALTVEFVEGNDAAHEGKPFLRVISFAPGSPCLTQAEKRSSSNREDFHRVAISRNSCDLGIFDLPLGRKYPSPEHRQRIIDFLLCLVRTGIDDSSSDDKAIAEIMPRLVDTLYTARDRDPRRYEEGIFPEIDDLMGGFRWDTGELTWWEISAKLADRYLTHYAQWAMGQAVPTISDCMSILRSVDMRGVTSTGERVVDVAARKISSALREYKFLSSTRRPGERHAKISVVEIDGTGDDRVSDLLFLIAENDYRMLVESIQADEALREIHKMNRIPRSSDTIRLMVAVRTASPLVVRHVAELMDDAVENDREVVVFTDHIEACPAFIRKSSSNMVYGVRAHTEVAKVGNVFDLEMEYTNVIHDHMVGLRYGGIADVPMVGNRRKFHMFETSTVICPAVKQ